MGGAALAADACPWPERSLPWVPVLPLRLLAGVGQAKTLRRTTGIYRHTVPDNVLQWLFESGQFVDRTGDPQDPPVVTNAARHHSTNEEQFEVRMPTLFDPDEAGVTSEFKAPASSKQSMLTM